jgi:hypothetical protein
MSVVDDLYRSFVDEYRRSGDADPRPYLDELTGVDRAELSLRIDHFLNGAPPRAFDTEAFARFRADSSRAAMVARVLDADTLLSLRETTNLTKAETARALAQRLGLGDRELAVKARYHDLEVGNADPSRVRQRVWEALSAVLRAPVDRLRDAAEIAFAGGPVGGPAFARSVPLMSSQRSLQRLETDEAVDAAQAEVDRVFFND